MQYQDLKKKFRVGVCGHRNLKKTEIEHYKEQVTKHLKHLIKEYPRKELFLVSSLADGADRLSVECAVDLGLRYEVVLPMDINLYKEDFKLSSKKEFISLFLSAAGSWVIPLVGSNTFEQIKNSGDSRDQQYLASGQEIINRSEHTIFLYDGVDNQLIGGTADILNYAKYHSKSFIIIKCEREQ